MPPVSTPLLSAGADGTGFITPAVAPTAGRLIQLTVFCASTVSAPEVTSSAGLVTAEGWVRIDDPSQFPNEPILRFSAIAAGTPGTIELTFTGSGGGIGYILEEFSGPRSTVLAAYRDLGGGARATKLGPPFTPGTNIPAAFANANNRASLAFSGTQFSNWAGGGTWNGGAPTVPQETALGLVGVTQTARSQTNPNISIDLVGAMGAPGPTEYGISWTFGPFTSRGIYSEIVEAEEAAPELTNTPPTPVEVIASSLAVTNEATPTSEVASSALAVTNASPTPLSVWASSLDVPFTAQKSPYPFTIRQIHSGHSLTDPGFHPFPGPWIYMLDNVLGLTTDATITKAVIPGSPMHWRWANEATLNPSARFDIGDWEVLIITEGVPLPLDGSSETHLALYATNAWTNGNGGAGAPTLLFTTWTNIDDFDGPWRAMLDTYEPEWEGIADAATAALPPGAPPVFIIPGHRMMARFYDDIAASATPSGIDNISDFFRDNIHLNDLGTYAWCMLHYACMFGVSPVGIPADIWGPNQGWGDDNVEGPPTIPTLAQATYIQEVVWDVVTSYSRTGITLAAPITNTSPTPVSVAPSALAVASASPVAETVAPSVLAVASGAPVSVGVAPSRLAATCSSPSPLDVGASTLALGSTSPVPSAVAPSAVALTNASPTPVEVAESSLGNSLTNTAPTPLPVGPSRLAVTARAPLALAIAASVLVSVAAPPAPLPVAPSRLALVARPPVALGVGPSRLALAASPPLTAPVRPAALALTSRSPLPLPVGPSSVRDSLTNTSPVPLPVGASCLALVARPPVPRFVAPSVLTLTSASPVGLAVGPSAVSSVTPPRPPVTRLIEVSEGVSSRTFLAGTSGVVLTKTPGSTLDFVVDFSRLLAPGESLEEVEWSSSGLSPSSTSLADSRAVGWFSGGVAWRESLVTLSYSTSRGRSGSVSFRLLVRPKDSGAVLAKQAGEREDFYVDLTRQLEPGETLSSVAWNAIGLDVEEETIDEGRASAWLSGGARGRFYPVTLVYSTSSGRVREFSFRVATFG